MTGFICSRNTFNNYLFQLLSKKTKYLKAYVYIILTVLIYENVAY